MTYNIRQPVLCDGQPGMVYAQTKTTDKYDVLLLTGEVRLYVTPDRLRPRVMEAVQ